MGIAWQKKLEGAQRLAAQWDHCGGLKVLSLLPTLRDSDLIEFLSVGCFQGALISSQVFLTYKVAKA